LWIYASGIEVDNTLSGDVREVAAEARRNTADNFTAECSSVL
jgi:hypothetical protein